MQERYLEPHPPSPAHTENQVFLYKTGVLAGVCDTDPFRVMDQFLAELKQMGFCGVQNSPTVGLIDGTFRANLEETGMGYDGEV